MRWPLHPSPNRGCLMVSGDYPLVSSVLGAYASEALDRYLTASERKRTFDVFKHEFVQYFLTELEPVEETRIDPGTYTRVHMTFLPPDSSDRKVLLDAFSEVPKITSNPRPDLVAAQMRAYAEQIVAQRERAAKEASEVPKNATRQFKDPPGELWSANDPSMPSSKLAQALNSAS